MRPRQAATGRREGGPGVRGLGVAEHGLRLFVIDPDSRRAQIDSVRFRVVEEQDRMVRDFDFEHTKRMRPIVARRDLTGFQHLNPEQHADGAGTCGCA